MSNSWSLVSRRGLGLAGLVALGLCAVCCAGPLLAAAGIGGSLLSGLSGSIRPGVELVAGGLVSVGVFCIMVIRRRGQGTKGCETACTTSGCGCGKVSKGSVFKTPTPGPHEPIVCTADLRGKPAVQAQLAGYRAAFAQLARTERFPGGVRWVFANRAGLLAELRRLAQNEHQCCKFFQFELRHTDSEVVWETTARAEAAAVLEEFGRLPERLREQPAAREIEAVKARITEAGLVFAADAAESK